MSLGSTCYSSKCNTPGSGLALLFLETSATNVNINTKTSQASEKSARTRKGNISSASRVTKIEDGEFREMISNLMEPSHPFLLPRTVPTSAGVIFHKPQISIVKNLQDEPNGVMILRPNVEQPVSYSVPTGVLQVQEGKRQVPSGGDTAFDMQQMYLYLSSTFKDGTGGKIIPEISPAVDGNIIEPDGSVDTNVKASYPHISYPLGASIHVTVESIIADSAATLQLMNLAGTVVQSLAGNFVTGVWKGSLVTTAPGNGFSLRFVFANGVTHYSVRYTIGLEDFTTQAGGYKYKDLSLWDMLGNVEGATTSRTQYYSAERYSITAFSALLKNTTAAQYKSGSIVAAQLPGGSAHLIPQDPEAAYKFISSYNDPKTHSGQLNKGVHWFFTPEKVQDWFFRPTEDPEGERPFLAIAWSGVATNDLANMLGLTLELRMNIELLTTDISLMKFMPSADLSRLFDLYITLVSAHNPAGENPSHRERIRKIVNSIATNPYVKNGIKASLLAGKALIPLALAAI